MYITINKKLNIDYDHSQYVLLLLYRKRKDNSQFKTNFCNFIILYR